MDFDDEALAPKPQPKDLSRLGVEELKEYIAELEEEIVRANKTIAAKQAHGSSVEGLFRK